MPKPLYLPPAHLVKEWPEVFDELYMNTMPVNYLKIVHIEFHDGSIWEINVAQQLTHSSPDNVAEKLSRSLSEFRSKIKKLDFKLDINQLKKDITESTESLLA